MTRPLSLLSLPPFGPSCEFSLSLSLVALALTACGSATAPAPSTPAPVLSAAPPVAAVEPSVDGGPAAGGAAGDGKEQRLIAKMLKRVEQARGVSATGAVPGVVMTRARLLARVKEHLAAELPPEAIRNEGLALQLFGFVPTTFDYEAAEYELLQDQLAGYYEPADRTMYMAGDLGQTEAEATLAHELVHALQDQKWDLATRCKYHPGEGDKSEAVSALAEGDATSAMFDVLAAHATGSPVKSALDIPDEVFAAQVSDAMGQGPGSGKPRIMRSSLAAPYIYGTLFVHALRRRGGWAGVNKAWDDAPITTEQIMHLDKWLAHEKPMAVPPQNFDPLGAGWSVADDDSEGELGTRLAMEEWTDPRTAAELATGWGGDRGLLLRNGDRVAYVWALRYDPSTAHPPRATATFGVLEKALEKEGHWTATAPSFACRARPDRGPFSVFVAGDDLVFTMGPAEVKTSSWKSAGDCTLARAWSKAIVADATHPRP